ncbi:PREDICTED: 2'-5'-oligoadenylate synthase-like protein 2 [Gekko japonicus]|uniref:2'-5'-oligoadenylate synthase-like protein 2 n=1 Tax=Gekko japonicus TaxID=146911 RepID=A0ABM1K3Y9_GEKJA|nr:PREDICTED: 2'-5'-oligoadenylate synthase-like protein 2 [Gekko japonicus]
MELYRVSSCELDGWIAAHLQPSEEFLENVQAAVQRICNYLKKNFSIEARVIKLVKGGSAGQGKVLQDNSDADPILFLHWFSSYDDQRERSECVIDSLKQALVRDERTIAYKVHILPPEAKGRPPHSLSLTLQSKNKKESVELDILPAYDVLEQVTLTYKPPPKIYEDLVQATKVPGEFSTSFIKLQRNFVKQSPEKLKDLLRLVKHWYKENLKKVYPSSSLPSKFALELLTIYAWEEGTKKAEEFNMAEGFCTVMKLLVQYKDLCFYWTEYYSLEDPTVGAHVKEKLRETRPVIMDPADPTRNLGTENGWDLLAKEASACQNELCCKKDDVPVQPWIVQPARAIQVRMKQQKGASQDMSCSPYDTIGQIKEKFGLEGHVSIYEKRTALQQPDVENTVLQNDKTLADYGVFYNTTILQLHTKQQ